jgi:uroporphyrinogen decarboxylase
VTSRERVEAALAGRPADRPPAGAWGHTYKEEWSPEDLARVTVERAREMGWDFVKFQPRATCFAEAFGSEYRYSGNRLKGPVLIRQAISSVEDWAGLRPVNPDALWDQARAIGLAARELGPDVPIIQTVFSPITVGGYLVGKNKYTIRRELRERPELVVPALERMGETLIEFSRRSVAAGAAGVFYAISGYASADFMKLEEYRNTLLALDRHILDSLPAEAWFNVLHLCGSNLNFEVARELPVQAVSWSVDNKGNPALAEGHSLSGKAVMGGVGQRTTLRYGPADAIRRQVAGATSELDGRWLLLAPGCSVPPRVSTANLKAMATAAAA